MVSDMVPLQQWFHISFALAPPSSPFLPITSTYCAFFLYYSCASYYPFPCDKKPLPPPLAPGGKEPIQGVGLIQGVHNDQAENSSRICIPIQSKSCEAADNDHKLGSRWLWVYVAIHVKNFLR